VTRWNHRAITGILVAAIITPLPVCVKAQSNQQAPGGSLQSQEGAQLFSLANGERRQFLGNYFAAKGNAQFIRNISSEFVTLAVISGELTWDESRAIAGQAIVIPITNANRIEVLEFDAARLLATIDNNWLAQVRPNLEQISHRQKRKIFWGLLEQTGVNTSAPVPSQIERVRQSYLSQPAVVELRRRSFGNRSLLQSLTVSKFKDAMIANDGETIAALLDPLPFSDTNDNSQVWQNARRSFAENLLKDAAMKAAFRAEGIAQEPITGQFYIGPENSKYIVTTVARDSAVFIAAVEPIR
jgi:hypothetical protein